MDFAVIVDIDHGLHKPFTDMTLEARLAGTSAVCNPATFPLRVVRPGKSGRSPISQSLA